MTALYSGNLLDERNGRPIESAELWVYTNLGVQATLTDALGQPLTQPIITGADGEFKYKAADGVYRHDFWKNSVKIYRDARVIVGTPGTIDVAVGTVGGNVIAANTNAGAAAAMGLSASTGGALVGLSSGETVQDFATRQSVPFEKYLATNYNYLTDDCSAALVTAWAASIANNTIITFSKRYYLAQGAALTGAGAFHFDGARFDLSPSMTAQTVFGATAGKIGILWKNAGSASVTGDVRFYGRGADTTPSTGTSLAATMFYRCDYIRVLANIHAEDMSFGRLMHNCNDAIFGDISGLNISGSQLFGAGTGGDLQVVIGCKRTRIGKTRGLLVFKAGLYWSTGADQDGIFNVNTDTIAGDVFITKRVGSTESSAVAFRMAVRCQVGNVATNSHIAVLGRTYLGDAASTNDLNRVGNVTRYGASGTGGLIDYALGELGAPTFGSLVTGDLSDDGSAVGINIATTAKVTYGRAKIVSALPVSLSSGANLIGGYTEVSGQSAEAAVFNSGSLATISQIHIASGHSAGGAPTYQGVRNYATTGVSIDRVTYSQNGIGQNVLYPYFADNSSPSTCPVLHCPNVGSSGYSARWQGFFADFIRDGRIFTTGVPASGTWVKGDEVFETTPVVGGIGSRVCTVAGTPGTWTASSVVGLVQAANIAAIATADATDLATAITLVNATKAKVNAILAGQVTAKQMA